MFRVHEEIFEKGRLLCESNCLVALWSCAPDFVVPRWGISQERKGAVSAVFEKGAALDGEERFEDGFFRHIRAQRILHEVEFSMACARRKNACSTRSPVLA